jgi:hypothetical protein
MERGIVSVSSNATGFAYSDILVAFTLVILASGWVFYTTFRGALVASGSAAHGH